jgi:hypothetical protein
LINDGSPWHFFKLGKISEFQRVLISKRALYLDFSSILMVFGSPAAKRDSKDF